MVLRAARVGPHRQVPGCCGGADWQESKTERVRRQLGSRAANRRKQKESGKPKTPGPSLPTQSPIQAPSRSESAEIPDTGPLRLLGRQGLP